MNLISLALAAEARGKAQTHLDRARVLAESAAHDLVVEASEIVNVAQDALIRKAKPGDQIRMPTLEAGYATRAVHMERTEPWRRRLSVPFSATAPDGASQKPASPSPGAYEDEQKKDFGDEQSSSCGGGE